MSGRGQSHGNCEWSEKPTLSSSDCGHTDVSNEATNPHFYVRSLVFKYWQSNQIFVKHLGCQSKQGSRPPMCDLL